MIKAISVSLLAMLITVNAWGEGRNYLKGITILGEKKIAYFSVEGESISVSEGDEITVTQGEAAGNWQVIRIEQNSVLLKNDKGYSTQLRLDSQAPLPEKVVPPLTEEEEEGIEILSEEEINSEEKINHEENPTAHDDAPIGDDELSVKEEPEPVMLEKTPLPSKQKTPPLENPPSTTKETEVPEEKEVPPGHRLIRTPFGEFMVKDRESVFKKSESTENENEETEINEEGSDMGNE